MFKAWTFLSLTNAAIGIVNAVAIVTLFGLEAFGSISIQIALIYMFVSYIKHGCSYAVARSSAQNDLSVFIYAMISYCIISALIVMIFWYDMEIINDYNISHTIIYIFLFEGLLRIFAEYFRGSNTSIRFAFFVFGDCGFKFSIFSVVIYTFFQTTNNSVTSYFFNILLVLVFLRLVMLCFVMFFKILKRYKNLKNIIIESFGLLNASGLKNYWAVVGTSVFAEGGSTTVIAIFLKKIEIISGLEVVGIVRIVSQVIGVLSIPSSIIEGYISPTIKKISLNGSNLSKLYPIRFYINGLNIIYLFIGCLIFLFSSQFENISFNLQLTAIVFIILVCGTFVRGSLGSPYFIFLSLGMHLATTYIASFLGIFIIIMGLLLAENIYIILIIFALNSTIVDLILSIIFSFRRSNIDSDYIGLGNIAKILINNMSYVKHMSLENLLNSVRKIRE
jgi:hypothetical protein